MTDEDVAKLLSKLTKSLATKEDINGLKLDFSNVKENIKKLATKEEIKKLATKNDIKRLEGKIDNLDDKANTILEFAEAVDETTTDHEKRLKRIETIPAIAHQIKK